MRGVLTIFRRELAGLFLGPLAWILLCAALALSGWVFAASLAATGGDVGHSLQLTMGGTPVMFFLLLVLPPLLTMRMISEEARSGMLEFLLTAPVTDRALVAGKFLAAAGFMALLWTAPLGYGLLVWSLGGAPDWPAVLGAYLGLLLVSALFCAIGLFSSACTSTPLLAAFVGFVVNVLLLLLPDQLQRLGDRPWLTSALRLVHIPVYFEPFTRGVIDSASLVFFLCWTLVFLFLSARTVEQRRWR